MHDHPLVYVIVGSVRANRLCPRIAAWVAGIGSALHALSLEIVDLADWPLPMDEEPGMPQLGEYVGERTLAWSEKIARADGFVLVSPQYNWGYPAALKNALDHLHREWRGKPVTIVSYGGHGGVKCAAQLRQVAEGLRMRPTATLPALQLAETAMRGGDFDPLRDFAGHAATVETAFTELAELLAADA